jgi:hypothetical protein
MVASVIPASLRLLLVMVFPDWVIAGGYEPSGSGGQYFVTQFAAIVSFFALLAAYQ